MPSNSIKWLGTNFPQLYEWLVKESQPATFRIRVLDPGNPLSPIEVSIDGFVMKLNVSDVIVEEGGVYFVSRDGDRFI